MSRKERREEQRRNKAKARGRAKAAATPRAHRILETIPPMEQSSAANSVQSLLSAVLSTLLRRRANYPASFPTAGSSNRYILVIMIVGLLSGFVGALLFYVGGAHKYFNPWFTFLRPLLALAAGLLIYVTAGGLLRVRYPAEESRDRRNVILSTIGLIHITSTIPWCLSWLELFTPSWKHYYFYLALPGIVYGVIITMGMLRPYFYTRQWTPFVAPAVLIYPVSLYFVEDAAMAVVRVLGL